MSTGPGNDKYFNYETQQWVSRPEYLMTENLSEAALKLVNAANEVVSLWEKPLLDTFKIMTQQASAYKAVLDWKPSDEQEKSVHTQLLEHLAQLDAYFDAFQSEEAGPPDWNGKDDLGIV